MDYKYINQLLERYWKCETSLEEEEILRAFFSQEDLPAELKPYQALFAYEQQEAKNESLGEDFDKKMLDIINDEYAKEPNKAKVVSLTARLKPLFKAAAIVAMFLTLSNAIQVPFSNNHVETIGDTQVMKSTPGASVAMGDSTKVDSMQHTSINQVASDPSTNILK